MHRQAKRTLVVLIAIIALIAGQLWVTAYACSNASNVGTSSVAATPVSVNVHGDSHDQLTGNLCQAHCDNTGQTDHAPQSTPSSAVWLPMIWGHPGVQTCAVQLHVPGDAGPPLSAASPPARVLFQVFRI
ncbi:hypothetical protein EOS_41115 [Caballeronia mineralivorans PML1(12)]|uniref:Uncharacterized protein n=1 Tax=Caballeronia mineralivorans PML1(12) TaxID=908627 RepID=A0A0J1CIU1_9BURK|nr:hypothetical protein [Caballeronia mineralivorans]KLU20509.1 hypothetical protein EOS_41115 [Caballeronia mineralivorans PML1(12)]